MYRYEEYRFSGVVAIHTASTFVGRGVPNQSLYGQIAPGWWLVQPLSVTIEHGGDGTYIVSDDLFLVYGVGDSLLEAMQDYVVSLIEYYQLLEARIDTNPLNRPQFEHLQVYLHPVNQSSHAA